MRPLTTKPLATSLVALMLLASCGASEPVADVEDAVAAADSAPTVTAAPQPTASPTPLPPRATSTPEVESIADDSPEWCGVAEEVEFALSVVERFDKGTPEELEQHLPEIIRDLTEHADLVPDTIRQEMTAAVAIAVATSDRLAAAAWDVDAVEVDEATYERFARTSFRVVEHNGDFCGIENGAGTFIRVGELEGTTPTPMESGERALLEKSLSNGGLATAEIDCLVDVLERVGDQMSNLLESYGFCGIPFHRFVDAMAKAN